MAVTNPNLEYYKRLPVLELVTLPAIEIPPGAQERHRIFAHLLMALVHYYWSPMKKGRNGTYPHSERSLKATPCGQRDYLGHNIAALAVNDKGQVLDFEFNHNTVFNSSAEHAEARLVRRIYGLSQVMDAYSGSAITPVGRNDYDTFEDVTIYTSLESCSQCSGMMALARVKEVVYLQTDPGMYSIGNIMHNLTRKIEGASDTNDKLVAPRPIPGGLLVDACPQLENAYEAFRQDVSKKPFFEPNDPEKGKDSTPSITSFLCTDAACDIFGEAENVFRAMTPGSLAHGDHLPKAARCKDDHNCGPDTCGALNNRDVLERAKHFFSYATTAAKRGTPHP